MSNLLGRSVESIIVPDSEFQDDPILPSGKYQAVITNIIEGTNEERGEDWVKLTFQVTSGPHEGAKLADFWSYGGSNPQKQEISDKKFKSLLKICGVTGNLESFDQLTFKQLQFNNKQYLGRDGVTRNSINYYMPANSAPSAAPSQSIPTPNWGQTQAPPAPMPPPVQQTPVQQPVQPPAQLQQVQPIQMQQPAQVQQQMQPMQQPAPVQQMAPQQAQVAPQAVQMQTQQVAQQPVQPAQQQQSFDPNGVTEAPPW